MDNASRVYIFKSAKHLINKELHVIICQPLCANNIVQVGAHEMGDQVDLLETLQGSSVIERIEEPNYVFMVHVLQQTQLTECPFGMGGSLKGTIKFLDGNLCVRDCVHGGAVKINNRMKS